MQFLHRKFIFNSYLYPTALIIFVMIILFCIFSFNSYIFDVGKDPKRPELFKIIDGSVLRKNDVSAPHTAHCLASGQVMISTMGDGQGNGK